MQFTQYDNLNKKIDRTKSWINPKYKQVFSAEVSFSKYCQILNTYNPSFDEYEYFVAFMDKKDAENKNCRIDEIGRTRFSIAEIWDKFCPNITSDTQVNLEYIETVNGADIFKMFY